HLGAGRHQGNNRRKGSLINIGSPDLEGRGRDFEADADQNHAYSKDRKPWRWAVGKRRHYLANVGGSRSAKGQGDAIKKEGSGEGTEKEILETRFRALAGALAKGSQDAGRDGRNFQADDH